jgi:8-oxo-dGTP pyrophosphatase MutT (NUDIX family)
VRAQVVLLRDDLILLARHERENSSYWVLPGGSIEADESPEAAAIREVREETGLTIEIDRLLFIDGPRHASGIDITEPRYTYLGHIIGGELSHVVDETGNAGKGRLHGAEWMPFNAPQLDEPTRDTLRLVQEALTELWRNHRSSQ